MSDIISNPRVSINGQVVALVPDSLEVTPGRNKVSVMSQSIGNGKTTLVSSVDVKESVGKIKFTAYCTAANTNLFDDYNLDNSGNLNVAYFGISSVNGESISGVINGGFITDEITYKYAAEGTFDVTITGQQLKRL